MPATPIIVRNPATGVELARVPDQGADEVSAAVARARDAQKAWAALPFDERARHLHTLMKRLMGDQTFLDTLVAESGKPRYEAEGIELFYTLELLRFLGGRHGRKAIRDEVRHPFVFAHKRARVLHHPRGVVGVIGPWNWPLLNNFADAIPPLLAGNAVVLKPSPQTPLTSLQVARHWQEAGLPASVLEVVTGGGETGAALVETCDMIFFTGSQRTGRAIAGRCGERLIPCVLELGGKSPMIVLGDADLPRAAHAAVWSSFAHSGQICIRTEVVLVDASVADTFERLCVEETQRLRQGPPAPPGPQDTDNGLQDDIDVGAVTFAPQLAHMETQIADAVARGARVLTGGHRLTDHPGQFFAPTILGGVTPDMAVAREETFGPLMPIVRVPDAETALRVANSSTLGLSGSVWSGDANRGGALARRLEAGSVCVNDVLVNYFCVEAPLGGAKQSGLGFRHGPEALRQFCWTETIVEDRWALGALSPTMGRLLTFPYRPSVQRLLRRFMNFLYG